MTVFRTATLRTFFFAIFPGAKELKTIYEKRKNLLFGSVNVPKRPSHH